MYISASGKKIICFLECLHVNLYNFPFILLHSFCFFFFFPSNMWQLWNNSVWMGTLEEHEEQRGICKGSEQEAIGVRSSVPPVKTEIRRMRPPLLLRDKAQQLEFESDSEAVASTEHSGWFICSWWLTWHQKLVTSLNCVYILALRGTSISSVLM